MYVFFLHVFRNAFLGGESKCLLPWVTKEISHPERMSRRVASISLVLLTQAFQYTLELCAFRRGLDHENLAEIPKGFNQCQWQSHAFEHLQHHVSYWATNWGKQSHSK